MGENRGNQVHIALQSQFEIAGEIFYAVFVMGKDGQLMLAGWKNKEDRNFSLNEVTNQLHIPLPDSINFTITMDSIDISYYIKSKALGFRMVSREYGSLSFQRAIIRQKTSYKFDWNLNKRLEFCRLPIIGKYMTPGDSFVIDRLKLHFMEGEQPRFQFVVIFDGLGLKAKDFQIGDCEEEVCDGVQFGEVVHAEEQALLSVDAAPELPSVRSDIHWLELKKDLGIFQLHKLGFALEGGRIRLYLNAGFTLSILEMEFIELYLSIAFENKLKTEFGIKGLVVSVDRDSFYLSGGLYISSDGLYNGMLTIRFQKFSMVALASYGKLPGSSEASFFAYLAVNYPLGGTPAFFVNGLAAGFGIHRALRQPDIKHVSEFPLVKAAMGKTMKIEDAADALEYMGNAIYMSEGNYFVSAGIRFTGFGMVEAFALLNIQFGARTEISLLGIADAALPAKVAKPIAFIRLALRMVFAPEDGIFQMSGALTQDSYLLDPSCRLQGGFALYTWFKGEHKGDFVLSVGGYHPKFHCAHYPLIDRVGINWIINDNLSIKGSAYFALTPNCIMAGGNLEVLYSAGKLKAWCRAYANILIGWRPFYYDIELGVSLGASYRVDFMFIHKTFTLEIGADMRIKGPEFSGYVHIKWFIISFTIHFGKEDKAEKKIDWKTFADNFLPSQGKNDAKGVPKLCIINMLEGLLGKKEQEETKKEVAYYVNGQEFSMEIQSRMPCSEVRFQGNGVSSCQRELGILPMKFRNLQVDLDVFVKDREGGNRQLLLEAELIQQDMPAALWDTAEVDLQKGMLKNIPAGLQIKAKKDKRRMLPGIYTGQMEDCYLLSNLTQNHMIYSKEHIAWNPKEAPADKDWQGKKGVELMGATLEENEVRRRYLGELSGYGVYAEKDVKIKQYKENLRTILWAPPLIRRTGSRGTYVERNGR